MHFFLDKFEDNGWARLEREDGKSFDVPREWLPEEAREGDVLKGDVASQGQASRVSFTVDDAEKARRLEEVRTLRENRPVAPEGDITL